MATGTAERDVAYQRIHDVPGGSLITFGADKAYDARDVIKALREINVSPHVAQNTSGRSSGIDGRTTRHAGYAISQRKRKMVNQVFGWMKTIGGMRGMRHRGVGLVGLMFVFTTAAYDLVRVRKLIQEAA